MTEESPEPNKTERERQVEAITDPGEAFEMLAVNEREEEKLTPEQIEKLKNLVELDGDILFKYYAQYVESGAIADPTDEERELIVWTEHVLMKTEEPEIAEYLLEHGITLSDEDREIIKETLRT